MSIRSAKTALGLSVVLLIALCCLSVYAQSGRRQSKPAPAAPVPTPTPEATPTPAPKKNDNEMMFLVLMGDRGNAFANYPITYVEAAAVGCADRLRDRSSLGVDLSSRDSSRGEAIEKAKAGKRTYVVLISLVENRMAGANSQYVELEVDYVVFAPETAKVLTSGRTYEYSARKGPLSIPRSRGATLPAYREQMLHRAGQDAADRILKALHLDTVPRTNHKEAQEAQEAQERISSKNQ